MFHGTAGVGKTCWAAQGPSPLFLLSEGETGLHTLIDAGIVPPLPNLEFSDWLNFLSVLDELTSTEHPYKTLIVDTLDGIEKIANAYVCEHDYQGDRGEKGFEGYQRGYRTVASGPWRELLVALDRLRVNKRMRILLLAHSQISNFQNPEGPDFNRWTPNMHKESWQLTYGWADIVLFGHRELAAKKADKGDRKPKGTGGDKRIIMTEWQAIADAKNRHNLPEEIEMGNSGKEAWDNFCKAVKDARKSNGKERANAS